jgi:hypothetical protein
MKTYREDWRPAPRQRLGQGKWPLVVGRFHRLATLVFPLLLAPVVHADLVLEQHLSDANGTENITVKLHDDKMRMDEPKEYFSVIVDLQTHDSITLFTNIKRYLKRSGDEVRRQMEEARKTGQPDDMPAPALPPVDTGTSETVAGYPARIFRWLGASGRTETLWVATNFPDYTVIQTELRKLDRFNDSGPHRNAQPQVSQLPGMVVKSVNDLNGHLTTNILVAVRIESVAPGLFEMPTNYTQWQPAPIKVGPPKP